LTNWVIAGEDGRMAETQHLNRMLLEAFRAVDAQVDAALEARGASNLSPRHATALLLIDRSGVRLTDLAVRAGITKQAMMQVVNDLDRLRLVERSPDPNDARAKIVKLTARGERERAPAATGGRSTEQKLRRRLGADRYEALKGDLETLTR
jgi:DNA-binding MarR family transcriptional regulator